MNRFNSDRNTNSYIGLSSVQFSTHIISIGSLHIRHTFRSIETLLSTILLPEENISVSISSANTIGQHVQTFIYSGHYISVSAHFGLISRFGQ